MIAAIRRRLRGHREEGLTLVELIVFMALSGLVLTLVGIMFVNVAKSTVASNGRRASTAVAQNVYDALATDVRAGTNITTNSPITWSIVNAGADTITLITYTDAGPAFGTPYQIKFSVDANGNMVESRWSPPASVSSFPLTSAPDQSRMLGSKITAFSLQYIYGACATTPCTNGDIDAVTVSITAQADGSNVPVNVTSTIYMPNAGSQQNYVGG